MYFLDVMYYFSAKGELFSYKGNRTPEAPKMGGMHPIIFWTTSGLSSKSGAAICPFMNKTG